MLFCSVFLFIDLLSASGHIYAVNSTCHPKDERNSLVCVDKKLYYFSENISEEDNKKKVTIAVFDVVDLKEIKHIKLEYVGISSVSLVCVNEESFSYHSQ